MITAGLVSTIKASPEEVLRFVNYHLNLGLDHLFLFFDDPDDRSLPLAEQHINVTCIRCDEAYWSGVEISARDTVIGRQTHNATLALKMARDQGLDWLLHIDVDELLHAPQGIKKIFATAPPESDTVIFRTWEAVPSRLYPAAPFLSRFFRVLPWPRRRWAKFFQIATRLGCGKYFLDGRYFRGHQIGKSAVRISSAPSRINPHKPVFHGRKCRPFLDHNAVVLHFESNSFDAWMRKMNYWFPRDWEGNPRAKTLTPQLTKFALLREAGGVNQKDRLQVLYKELYFIDTAGRVILRALGLLRLIRLNPNFFNRPNGDKIKGRAVSAG